MQSLDEKIWHKFKAFGKDGLFSIATTSSSIDGIRLIDGDNKTLPYVTRSDANNGIARFVSLNNLSYGYDKAGCITVGLDTQTAFWQPNAFVTGQNIQIITGAVLDESCAQFLIPLLRNQMSAKFNWGGNGATLGRMKSLELMLPVTNDGTPDYDYMTEYTQKKREAMLEKYRAYLEKRISELSEMVDIPALDEKEWSPYAIVELFTLFVPGKGKGLNHLSKTDNNGINYIGATNRNNGVLCYVANDDNASKMILQGNCIGFIKNGDGSAGYAIYKAEAFISTSDVIYGYADWLNRYTGLFFVAAQDMIENKYSHGYKRNRQHLDADRVMLPVNDTGEPDYDYMEQYAKNMMLKKYKQYLAYIDKKRVLQSVEHINYYQKQKRC